MAWRWADLAGPGSEAEGADFVEARATADAAAPQPMEIGLRFQAARPGDSISRLVGSSDPRAIGKFLSLNGMDGRNSTLRLNYGTSPSTQGGGWTDPVRRADDERDQ